MDKDTWTEIVQILIRKPLRTALAAIGIGWGIMMLILLVGAGNGLENGMKKESSNIALNSMFIWTMRTSMPYMGFQAGRDIPLTNDDVKFLEETIPEIEVVSPRNQLGGYRGGNNVSYKSNTGAFNIYGDSPDFNRIRPVILNSGRLMNEGDVEEKRKICVIGQEVVSLLFSQKDASGKIVNKDPLGEYITVNGVNFTVVGTFSPTSTGEDSEEELSSIFIPYTTFQRAFNMGDRVGWLSILSVKDYPVEDLQLKVEEVLKVRKKIHPEDKRAFGKFNMGERMGRFNVMFDAIDYIGYIIGGLVLFAGLIGVINIMLVTVKERTKEFGIRRAMGATPKMIISQVIKETILLTLLAGSCGAALGILLIEWVAGMLEGQESNVFYNPEVKLSLILIVLATVVVFGAIAGLMPAIRAVSIKPVDAIRAEN